MLVFIRTIFVANDSKSNAYICQHKLSYFMFYYFDFFLALIIF